MKSNNKEVLKYKAKLHLLAVEKHIYAFQEYSRNYPKNRDHYFLLSRSKKAFILHIKSILLFALSSPLTLLARPKD